MSTEFEKDRLETELINTGELLSFLLLPPVLAALSPTVSQEILRWTLQRPTLVINTVASHILEHSSTPAAPST